MLASSKEDLCFLLPGHLRALVVQEQGLRVIQVVWMTPSPAVPLSTSKLSLSETVQKGDCYAGVCLYQALDSDPPSVPSSPWVLEAALAFSSSQCRAQPFVGRSEMSSILASSLLLLATWLLSGPSCLQLISVALSYPSWTGTHHWGRKGSTPFLKLTFSHLILCLIINNC